MDSKQIHSKKDNIQYNLCEQACLRNQMKMDGGRTENTWKKNTGHKKFEKGNNGQTIVEGVYSRGPAFGCYALEDQEKEGVENKITVKTIVDVKNFWLSVGDRPG